MNERLLSPGAGRLAVGGLFVAYLGLLLLPRVQVSPGLWGAILGSGLLFLGWLAWVVVTNRREGRGFEVQVWLRPSHYIQMTVQLGIYIYWGMHWPVLVEAIPLLVAQALFGYLLDICMSWRKYGRFRLGVAPWPVTFSTNFFILFRDDYFAFQLAMISLAYISREFVKWDRDGQRVHIFNPSGFGMSIAAVILLAGGWSHLTWGAEIAQSLGAPHYCYEAVFVAGFVVGSFFPVILMTFAAAATTFALNAVWFQVTGVYHYVDTAIPIAVFIGMTLLVTDPVSTPRSNAGRVLYGMLYGAAVFVAYDLLGLIETPGNLERPGINVTWYDKLLPLLALNLLAKPLDLVCRGFSVKSWKLGETQTRLLHVGLWTVAFLFMRSGLTNHPGRSLEFWRQACDDRRVGSCENLQVMYERHCLRDVGVACHNLGVMLEHADGVPEDKRYAAAAYGAACEDGWAPGCTHLGVLFVQGQGVDRDLAKARAMLDRGCKAGDQRGCELRAALDQQRR